MLAATDAREFDRPQLAALVFVMAGDAGDLVQGAFNSKIDHALDKAQIVSIRRCGAGVIAGLLHH
ncbi:hypothetical protein D3C87_1994110 [compost metagenome]